MILPRRSKGTSEVQSNEAEGLEVSGLTDSGNGKPNMEFATDEQDMPLTEQL
jgi:hypothetical protein